MITDTTCENPKQKEKKRSKGNCCIQKKIDIAKGKEGELRDILKCDVSETNMLCDGDVMVKYEKSKIIAEIQNLLPEQFILHDLDGTKMDNIHFIIDFTAVVISIQKQFSAKTFRFAW